MCLRVRTWDEAISRGNGGNMEFYPFLLNSKDGAKGVTKQPFEITNRHLKKITSRRKKFLSRRIFFTSHLVTKKSQKKQTTNGVQQKTTHPDCPTHGKRGNRDECENICLTQRTLRERRYFSLA